MGSSAASRSSTGQHAAHTRFVCTAIESYVDDGAAEAAARVAKKVMASKVSASLRSSLSKQASCVVCKGRLDNFPSVHGKGQLYHISCGAMRAVTHHQSGEFHVKCHSIKRQGLEVGWDFQRLKPFEIKSHHDQGCIAGGNHVRPESMSHRISGATQTLHTNSFKNSQLSRVTYRRTCTVKIFFYRLDWYVRQRPVAVNHARALYVEKAQKVATRRQPALQYVLLQQQGQR